MKLNVPDYISSITPYSPGKPLEELEREYGIRDSIKLASNENPLGASPKAKAAIEAALKRLHRYPESAGFDLVKGLAEKLKVKPENIVLGNGSDEIISLLTQVFLSPGSEAIMPKPSFLMYDILTRCAGATPVFVPLKSLVIDLDAMADRVTGATRMIFLTNPNNPTGMTLSQGDFERFFARIPREIIVVVDEAYIEFARDPECLDSGSVFSEDRPIVMLRTFSKVYGLAGLRMGYGIMPSQISELLNRIRLPFNASIPAQAGALAALQDDQFFKQTVDLIHGEIDFIFEYLDRIGVTYYPTQANFYLIDVKQNADDVYERFLKQGIIIRSMTSYGFPEYIRVTVGNRDENLRFLNALENLI